MAHSQHPAAHEIREYVRDTLSDNKHIEIGKHLFSCKQCMDLAREEYKNSILIENWSAKNIGELLWRMKILAELKNREISGEFIQDSEIEEKLAAQSEIDTVPTVSRHYYSKDKKVIATVEYSNQQVEVSFETRESDIAESEIVFAFVRINSRKIIVCDKLKLIKRSPGVWENRWKGKLSFSPDLTLLFEY